MEGFPHTMGLWGMGQAGRPWPDNHNTEWERLTEQRGTHGHTTAVTASVLHGKTLHLTGDSGQTQRRQEIKSLTLKGIDLSRSTGKPRITGCIIG